MFSSEVMPYPAHFRGRGSTGILLNLAMARVWTGLARWDKAWVNVKSMTPLIDYLLSATHWFCTTDWSQSQDVPGTSRHIEYLSFSVHFQLRHLTVQRHF